MPHICWDEIQFFLWGMPFVGYGLFWLRTKLSFRRKPACPCPHDHANDQKHA